MCIIHCNNSAPRSLGMSLRRYVYLRSLLHTGWIHGTARSCTGGSQEGHRNVVGGKC